MQNDKKSNGFMRFLRDKGYYIVLLLCAVAVGVSGYLLLSGRSSEPAEQGLSASESSSAQLQQESLPRTAHVAATDGSTPSEQPSESSTKGGIKTSAPVQGEQIAPFAAESLAYNATTRDWRTHEGIDLSAALGDTVKAAADGSVYTVYDDESLGTTVVLRHDGGYTTHYSNLAEDVAVKVGDTVKAGDTLGKVGHTANIETAAEPHLHFAVYRNNVPLDPAEFLKAS